MSSCTPSWSTLPRPTAKTGEASRAVAKVLHPHFLKEVEYALPPLGLLVRLSKGEFDKDMSEVLAMTDKLEAELPRMLSEHQQIVAALQELIAAAEAEGKPEVADFARKLTLHAQNEEQVAYPTSLLIGRYVKLRLEAVRRPDRRLNFNRRLEVIGTQSSALKTKPGDSGQAAGAKTEAFGSTSAESPPRSCERPSLSLQP
jgi:hypothetical protein